MTIDKPKIMNDFLEACRKGQLDQAKGIAQENPDLDIHTNEDEAFRWACSKGHLDVAQWLVDYATSIESPVDIHTYEDLAFRRACMNGHLDVARWLVPFGGMPIQGLQKNHPIRLFHVRRFPTIALLSLYFRRFVYGFRERYYCPGGKGYEAAKKDFEKLSQLP